MNIRSVFSLLAVSLLAIGCGGTGGPEPVLFKREKFEFNETQPVLEYSTEHAVPAPEISISLDGVPVLDELAKLERNTSGLEPTFRLGAELAGPATMKNSVVNGDSLEMNPDWDRAADPPTSELAYAIYGFNLPNYSEPGTLQLWWNSVLQPTDNLYIGVSDYSTGRWQWFLGPAGNSAMDFGPLADYFSDTDDIYFAVLLTGTGQYSLGQLRLGDNLVPTAVFTPDVTSGEVPLTVNFDASASADVDGDIVSYEWDYLGDGSYGSPLDQPMSSFEFTQVGDYLVTLRVTDNEGATRSGEAVVSVTPIASNQSPTADIQADVTSGTAPLTVNFDGSGSTDPDGSIAKYQWDLDGNDSFETDSLLVASASHEYVDAGTYLVKLRVTDDQGSTATDSITIEVGSVGGGAPPVAKLKVDYWFKVTDEDWQFDASASTDPDDDIVKYEFDWNNDGSFETDNGANPLISHPFGIGTHTVGLRVTDGGDRTDTDTITVVMGNGAPGNYHETEANDTFGTADSLGGFADYAALVDGWRGNLGVGGYDGSEEDWLRIETTQAGQMHLHIGFTGADADIDMKLFDESDTGTALVSSTGTGDEETINYSVPGPGVYFLRVYIFESGSKRGPADYLLDASFTGVPVAVVEATPLSGTAPLIVSFDMSASYHPDGFAITSYQLDPGGTGEFSFTSASSTFQYTYYTHGPFTAVVRAVDEFGGGGQTSVQINPSVIYDETENNDDFTTGNTLPSLNFSDWFGNLGVGGPLDGDENDWYKLSVPSAGTWTINMYFIDNISDLDMRLFDTNGTTELKTSTTTSDNESITYAFPGAGTYYLRCHVYTTGSQLDPQDYMLEIMPTPAP